MRIVLGIGGLAACILASDAAAQIAAPALPASSQTLSSTAIIPGQAAPEQRIRRRAASSMVDFFPVDGQGFHLSGGLRFFNSTSFWRHTAKSTRGLLFVPRSLGNSGIRWGYRRTPSMALGYSQALDEDVVLGFEVGAMLGRATSSMRRFGPRDPDRRRGGGGANSIAHLVFDVKF
ncbi:MAG: hypothetical protein V4574_17250 [Pseudomonadota bacterium]